MMGVVVVVLAFVGAVGATTMIQLAAKDYSAGHFIGNVIIIASAFVSVMCGAILTSEWLGHLSVLPRK